MSTVEVTTPSKTSAWLHTAWGMVRTAPVTVVLMIMLWVFHFVGGANPQERLANLGLGEHARLFSERVVTSGLTTSTLRGLIVCTLAVLMAGVAAERALGTRRYLAAAVGSQVIAMPVGVALGLAATHFAAHLSHSNVWGNELQGERVLNPIAWIIGPLAIVSAVAPTLWRRRIRTFLVVTSCALVLYSGSLSDFVFLVATFLGIIAGQLFFDRAREDHEHHGAVQNRMSVREKRVLVALVVGAVALSPIIAMHNPHAAGPFSSLTDLIWQPALNNAEVSAVCGANHPGAGQECAEAMALVRNNGVGPFVANVMPFVLQLVALGGLVRGRRMAWGLVLAFQLATIALLTWEIISLRNDADPLVVGVNFLFAISPWIFTTIILLLTRRLFTAPTSRRAVRRLLTGVGIAFAVSSIVWLVGAWLTREQFQPDLSWSMILKEWPLLYLPTPLSTPAGIEFTPTSALAWGLLEWPGNIVWIVATWLLYRAFSAPSDDNASIDRSRAQQLLSNGSGDHLSWMTLWDGNKYWFHGDGYVAYRVKNNVALTLGGPITRTGSAAERAEIMREFDSFAQHSGWHTAWYSVDDEAAAQLRLDGFRSQPVAEESILSTELAEFKGKKFQNIRTARNHAAKESITGLWTTWKDADPFLRDKIIALSEEWVSDKALPEMGFTLGTIEELKVDETRLLIAVDEDGNVHGVTSWLPHYNEGGVDGLVLDFMRRNPHGFRHAIEFLISEAMLQAKEEGLEWVSLSGTPLANSSDEQKGLLDSLLDKVGESMEPLYGFRTLAASKNKFQPQHTTWYLCYRDELTLPAIALAVCASYVPSIKVQEGVNAARAWLKAGK